MKAVGAKSPTAFFYFSFKKQKVAKENYIKNFLYSIFKSIFPSFAMPALQKTLYEVFWLHLLYTKGGKNASYAPPASLVIKNEVVYLLFSKCGEVTNGHKPHIALLT